MLKISWKLVFSFWATIFIPSLYLINIYISFMFANTFDASFQLKILGIILSFIGIIFWVISYLNLGHSFGVIPQKQKRVRKGLYKYFNHPMYMAIFITFLGISIANASWQGLIFLNLIIIPLLFVRAYFEDKNLT